MDKIIDGVDVSECVHFKMNRGFNCYKGYNCTDNKCYNCYYKQLQRLKKDYDEISNNSEILHENNSLRIANARLNEDLSQAEISMREWREQSIKYHKAMQEIRKLMHENDNIAGCEYCYGDIRYEILDKINEVIGGDNG